jgi:hypothetical protein
MLYVKTYAMVAATPTKVSATNGRRQSDEPSRPPSSVPASVPTPCERPQKLMTRPRRTGEIRSLTTEKPTEATAPRPTAATTWAAKKTA